MKINELSGLKALLPAYPPLIGRNKTVNAAVIIPLVEIGGSIHLLFQERAAHIPQGGEICFPGGEFDEQQDRSLWETALRETVEELGVGRDDIEFIGVLGTVVSLRGITVDCFIAFLKVGFPDELSINPNEVARAFTLPVDWFKEHPPEMFPVKVEMHPYIINDAGVTVTLFPAHELGLPEKYSTSWLVKDRVVPVYRTGEGVIWGMTAEVITELVMLLHHQ